MNKIIDTCCTYFVAFSMFVAFFIGAIGLFIILGIAFIVTPFAVGRLLGLDPLLGSSLFFILLVSGVIVAGLCNKLVFFLYLLILPLIPLILTIAIPGVSNILTQHVYVTSSGFTGMFVQSLGILDGLYTLAEIGILSLVFFVWGCIMLALILINIKEWKELGLFRRFLLLLMSVPMFILGVLILVDLVLISILFAIFAVLIIVIAIGLALPLALPSLLGGAGASFGGGGGSTAGYSRKDGSEIKNYDKHGQRKGTSYKK